MKPVKIDFYQRHPVEAAKDLLGKIIVRKIGCKILTGRIVETEAYSSDDPSSHSYRGITERNKPMFGEVGRAYVYFTYGSHFCFNVVARDDEPSGAVLIRALEPVEGVSFMKKYRGTDDIHNLASGPGKLTKAFKIDKAFNGHDLTKKGELFVAEGTRSDFKIKSTRRIGIGVATEKMWRFVIEGNEFLSR